MQQHPVPQDITTYQFRLVGDMTLKQFVELASGIGLAVLVYNAGLPVFFKWPLIFFFAFAGVAFAFLPFEERPLDVWVVNFFKSVYSPTRFLWKKANKLPDFLTYVPASEKMGTRVRLTSTERAQFAEYLQTLPQKPALSTFDRLEQESIDKINNYWRSLAGTDPNQYLIQSYPTPATEAGLPSIRIRKLRKAEEIIGEKMPLLPVNELPQVKIAQAFTPPLEIGTPFHEPVKPPKPKPVKPPPPQKPKPKPKKTIKEVTGPLPMPSLPELPNVVVGMTLDLAGRILPAAIIEIRDATGMPLRASKTNKVGQFFIVTPLSNGDYEIETEYPGLSFDIINFKAEGKIIPPIKIQAKS